MLVKISKKHAINPKHVLAVIHNPNAETVTIITIGMGNIQSDLTFEETLKVLADEKE